MPRTQSGGYTRETVMQLGTVDEATERPQPVSDDNSGWVYGRGEGSEVGGEVGLPHYSDGFQCHIHAGEPDSASSTLDSLIISIHQQQCRDTHRHTHKTQPISSDDTRPTAPSAWDHIQMLLKIKRIPLIYHYRRETETIKSEFLKSPAVNILVISTGGPWKLPKAHSM